MWRFGWDPHAEEGHWIQENVKKVSTFLNKTVPILVNFEKCTILM